MVSTMMARCKLRPSFFPTSSPKPHSLSYDRTPQNETLISAAVSILTNHRSKSRWSHLRSLLLPHGGALQAPQVSQITLLLRNHPHLALRFFLWTARNRRQSHSLLSYSTIVHVLARARLKSPAQSLLRDALRLESGSEKSELPPIFETLVKTYRTCDSAPFVFDLLVRACLESSRIDQAISVARILRSRSIYPQVITCNALIRSVTRNRGSHSGYAMYREVFGLDSEVEGGFRKIRVFPDVHTFNELMLGFYQDSVVEKVEEVWAEMRKLNCAPNGYSFSILMAAYCEEEKMVEAERLWAEMQVKEIKHDVVAYNTIIGGFCRVGDVGRAEEFFREMSLSGIEATCVTYENLINGYCKIRDVDSAMLLYKDMIREGFKPEASTIDAMIARLCGNKRVSEALGFFRNVMANPDYLPTRKTYKFLIEAFISKGQTGEALKLQEEMAAKGFHPCSEIYSAFIDGYIKEDNPEVAEALRKEMLQNQLQRGNCNDK